MANLFTRWLVSWRKPKSASPLPLGLTPQEIESLKALRATPQWSHFLRAVERLGEQQAAELASGLPHDKYLFACGALVALRRVYTLVDDLAASAAKLEEITDARERTVARLGARRAAAFVNTPWFDTQRTERPSA